MPKETTFQKLFKTIESRKASDPQESYTASLFFKGPEAINAKLREETEETCAAALEKDKSHLIAELADLFYHSFVLAVYYGIGLSEIEAELERRSGKSGLVEKAERKITSKKENQ